jgi:porin
MVWREPGEDSTQGLGLFFRAGLSPQDRSAYELALDGGLHYQGLIPGRDQDALGLGVAYVQISDDLIRAQKASGAAAISDYELALEVTYQFVVQPWWAIQPDFQWVHHPGGSDALSDAFVLGLRTRLTF